MTPDELRLWIDMADDIGDATDANVGRFALMRDRQARDLAALVMRMARQIHSTNEVRKQAIEYIRRNNLTTPLRESAA